MRVFATTNGAILAFAIASGTAAQPFQPRSDGRIEVEIFGQKIALPARDADLDATRFYPLRIRPFGEKEIRPTLRQALADSEKAEQMFEQEPNSISVWFQTDWPPDDRLVPGRFDPATVPRSNTASPLAVNVQRLPPSKPPKRGTLSDHWPPEAATPDEDGYFVRPGVKQVNRLRGTKSDPAETGYRLPAAQRLWPTDVDLVIVCRWVGAPVRVCRQRQETRDGRVAIVWSWYEESFPTARGPFPNFFPKSRWKELDLRLHEVAEYLLVNKPSGELD